MIDVQTVEKKWQKRWNEQDIGKAQINDKPKFFLIWAYASVSGFQHTGHMRGYSYADAIGRYKRLTGHNVLLTAGGHATGNGAIAKAQKIKEKDQAWIEEFKSRGLTEKEIQKITDPNEFVNYFCQSYIDDYKQFGFIGDWQRFMVTISDDYKKFITWQFHKLKEKNLLMQKPYYATACIACGPVAVDPSEMDLSKGGNAEVNEYTMIKLKFERDNQFIMCATLRPETMYGQTNIWIDPNLTYTKLQVGNEVWIVSKEAAEKLQYQFDNTKIVGSIKAKDMLGKYCHAPMVEREVIILPSEFCDPNIGTGIVTSVPSDAPHDYIALYDLQNSEELCKKYNLDQNKIKAIKIIPIINIPGFSDCAAVDMCKKLNIKSQKDEEKLEQAKKEIYKLGFHAGTLNENCGPFKGQKVTVAKEIIKDKLIQNKDAEIMRDLSEEVICRCGQPVIIKKVDSQWFIRYSDEQLTKTTVEHATKHMSIRPQNYADNVKDALEWFQDRPCARQGRWMGTPFPFDTTYVIEAISDSTLYPIYYIVSKYVNEKKLEAKNLTLEFFDYIFLEKGNKQAVAKISNIETQLLEQIQKDVQYWYPLDINLGGKEHRRVHFPPFMMNHVAILPQKYWPKGLFIHEWVMRAKGEKLSKSKGGAQPIPDVAKTYSVDAMRLFYANIGSPFADIYFNEDDIINYKQRIEKIFRLTQDLKEITQTQETSADELLQSKINRKISKATTYMEDLDLKKASDYIYMEMYRDFQVYMAMGGSNKEVLQPLLESWAIMMSMFTPHIAEEIWESLNKKDFVLKQTWPKVDESKIDENVERLYDLLNLLKTDINKVMELAKLEQATEIKIITAHKWKYELYIMLQKIFKETRDFKQVIAKIMATDLKQQSKNITKLLPKLIKTGVPEVIITEQEETKGLNEAKKRLEEMYKAKVIIEQAGKSQEVKANNAMPGKPAIIIK